MVEYVFELPADPPPPSMRARGRSRALTHKGEWLQGPVPIIKDSEERYTIGVFSLLDDLNSAYLDVRKKNAANIRGPGTFAPAINIRPNGWNAGEVKLVEQAVVETWREVGAGERCSYDVYGYHDIRVGAGSGSSSALVQATIRATALEHVRHLPKETLAPFTGASSQGRIPCICRTRQLLRHESISATR